jgi:protoheme ferro-lyase
MMRLTQLEQKHLNATSSESETAKFWALLATKRDSQKLEAIEKYEDLAGYVRHLADNLDQYTQEELRIVLLDAVEENKEEE